MRILALAVVLSLVHVAHADDASDLRTVYQAALTVRLDEANKACGTHFGVRSRRSSRP